MGMGFGAGFVLKLDKEKVETMVAEPFAVFAALLEAHGLDFGTFAAEHNSDEIIFEFENVEEGKEDEAQEEVLAAFEKVKDLFKEKTGLSLCLGYHASDDVGSCYDEVDGAYYALDFNEAYNVSEKAEALKETIPFDMSFFVAYG